MVLTVNIYETYVEIIDEEGNVVLCGATPEHFYIAKAIKDLANENHTSDNS